MTNVITEACTSFADTIRVRYDPLDWPRHEVKLPYYITNTKVLPDGWAVLKDGRIIGNGEVFYSNGTYYNFDEECGGL